MTELPGTLAAHPSTPPLTPARRIDAIDQFRGYTVAAMFVVNFCGGLKAIPDWIKHHDYHFSYADSIMPSFIFIAGLTYRLSLIRRIDRYGAPTAFRHAIIRGLGLVLVSLMLFGFGTNFETWSRLAEPGAVREFVAGLIKADLWEVLAIIGVCQIVILPFVATSWFVRLLAFLGLLVAHATFSHLFNFRFLAGLPNSFDAFWGAAGKRGWDGGMFGVLTWSAVMLAGTLAHDILLPRRDRPAAAAIGLITFGAIAMGIGYGLTCLSTLYTQGDGIVSADGKGAELADSPVIPPLHAREAGWPVKPAEPPFVEPPPSTERPRSYWMLSKRVVTAPFALFSSGFAAALLGLFVIVNDIFGLTLGVFGVLGRNPLAAYVLHHLVEHSILPLVPSDSPFWWCLTGLIAFFLISCGAIYWLDRQRIYIRL